MHFVKKEHIDSEEKNAQQKKRMAKLAAFTQARDRLFEKRRNGEYDQEMMTLTGELLNKNPDIYTLWNIRREAIEHFSHNISGGDDDRGRIDQLAKLIDGELGLTQDCLTRNPKSYSSWHHRFLMLQRHPKPDFPSEMGLCEKALSIDCRNFHCWDHARSIARLANIGEMEQFNFSDRMIGKNPSNYSAWHFRGNLIPRIYPNQQHPEMAISDECLAGEFEKVLHVCGVNSEDQTAWTYCRWLVEIASAQNEDAQKQLVISAKIVNSNAHFVFSEAVNRETMKTILILGGGGKDELDGGNIVIKGIGTSSSNVGSEKKWRHSRIWSVSPIKNTLKFTRHPFGDEYEQIDEGRGHFVNRKWMERHYSTLPTCNGEMARKCLNDLVGLCEELIANEDNPWEISALTQAKLALDGVTGETLELASQNCEKLKKIDPQRREMYAELMDRLHLVDSLNSGNKMGENGNGTQLDGLMGGNGRIVLKGIGLSSLLHLLPLSGLISELNLEDNALGDNRLAQLASFPLLTNLTLDGNPIQRLPPLQLPRLNFLSLARTMIGHFADIQSAICAFPSLERLILCETELASSPEEQRASREGIRQSIRLIFHWL